MAFWVKGSRTKAATATPHRLAARTILVTGSEEFSYERFEQLQAENALILVDKVLETWALQVLPDLAIKL